MSIMKMGRKTNKKTNKNIKLKQAVGSTIPSKKVTN